MPNLHLSGSQALITFLMMVAVFGSLHLLASSHPSNIVSQAWVSLGF